MQQVPPASVRIAAGALQGAPADAEGGLPTALQHLLPARLYTGAGGPGSVGVGVQCCPAPSRHSRHAKTALQCCWVLPYDRAGGTSSRDLFTC